MAEAKTRLNYRGYGPFLPYGNIERIVRDAGRVELLVDTDVAPVLEKWAVRRGYYVRTQDTYVEISIVPFAEEKRPRRGGAAKQAAKVHAPEEARLVVDEKAWRSDLAEKISNVTYIISAVLKAPMLYRGSPKTPAFRAIIATKKPMLVRISLNTTDYFILLLGHRVIAAAQLGAPLTPEQTKSIIEQMEAKDALITVYDASGLDVGREAQKQ